MTSQHSSPHRRGGVGIALVACLILGVACSDAPDTRPSASPSPEREGIRQPAVRQELLAMRDRDQAARSGEPVETEETDVDRTLRLGEIIEEFGWPTPAQVGKDGESDARLIALHSDFDVAFQQEALAMMQEPLETSDADAIEVAYLEDRVAVNSGQPQTYGTQIRCRRAGRGRPHRSSDRTHVDERRAELGLEPLNEYFARFDEACAAELER